MLKDNSETVNFSQQNLKTSNNNSLIEEVEKEISENKPENYEIEDIDTSLLNLKFAIALKLEYFAERIEQESQQFANVKDMFVKDENNEKTSIIAEKYKKQIEKMEKLTKYSNYIKAIMDKFNHGDYTANEMKIKIAKLFESVKKIILKQNSKGTY